ATDRRGVPTRAGSALVASEAGRSWSTLLQVVGYPPERTRKNPDQVSHARSSRARRSAAPRRPRVSRQVFRGERSSSLPFTSKRASVLGVASLICHARAQSTVRSPARED